MKGLRLLIKINKEVDNKDENCLGRWGEEKGEDEGTREAAIYMNGDIAAHSGAATEGCFPSSGKGCLETSCKQARNK